MLLPAEPGLCGQGVMFKYEGGEEAEQDCYIDLGILFHDHEKACRWDLHFLVLSAFPP